MSSDSLAWCGLVGTVLFGLLNVWQLIQYLIDRKVKDATKKHMRALRSALDEQLRMCANTLAGNEVIKSEGARLWVKQLMSNLIGLGHHIDAMLEVENIKPVQSTERGQKEKLVNSWITEGNALIKKAILASQNRQPDYPEMSREAETWISSIQKKIEEHFPLFSGQFDNDGTIPIGNTQSADPGYRNIEERLLRKQHRLGELLPLCNLYSAT